MWAYFVNFKVFSLPCKLVSLLLHPKILRCRWTKPTETLLRPAIWNSFWRKKNCKFWFKVEKFSEITKNNLKTIHFFVDPVIEQSLWKLWKKLRTVNEAKKTFKSLFFYLPCSNSSLLFLKNVIWLNYPKLDIRGHSKNTC